METVGTQTQRGGARRLLIFAALTLGLLALIASSVSATSAYFSDTETNAVVVSTGEVDISVSGLISGSTGPTLNLAGLMPGESVSSTFTVTNNAPGDGDVDLYTWVEFGNSQGVDLCGQIEVVVTGPGVPSNTNDICVIATDLDNSLDSSSFPSGSPLLITTPALSGQRTYNVEMTLATSAGNALAGFTSDGYDDFVVYATQAGADAPDFNSFNAAEGGYEAQDVFTQ